MDDLSIVRQERTPVDKVGKADTNTQLVAQDFEKLVLDLKSMLDQDLAQRLETA